MGVQILLKSRTIFRFKNINIQELSSLTILLLVSYTH